MTKTTQGAEKGRPIGRPQIEGSHPLGPSYASPVLNTDETSRLFDVFTYHTPFFSGHDTYETQERQGLPRTQASVAEGGPTLFGQSSLEKHIRLKLYLKRYK